MSIYDGAAYVASLEAKVTAAKEREAVLMEALVRCQRIARNPIGEDSVNRIIAVVDKALATVSDSKGD